MSYRTVEVELEHGRIRARKAETLPSKASGLLTILEPAASAVEATPKAGTCGLRRLLSEPDFDLTRQQFEASMEADFWEQ
jgi:hypothetical protein